MYHLIITTLYPVASVEQGSTPPPQHPAAL